MYSGIIIYCPSTVIEIFKSEFFETELIDLLLCRYIEKTSMFICETASIDVFLFCGVETSYVSWMLVQRILDVDTESEKSIEKFFPEIY